MHRRAVGVAYKVLSWNVEKLSRAGTEEERVAEHIRARSPSVFGLYEVVDADIYWYMRDQFKDYTMFITGGSELQEILVAVRTKDFTHVSIEQRSEFREGNDYLRPGALVSVARDGKTDTFLFLHTDSGTNASACGNRARMLERAFRLKLALDRANKNHGGTGDARFVVLGDLNTMGLEYPWAGKKNARVREEEEISGIGKWAADFAKEKKKDSPKANMRVLTKQHDTTWTNLRTTSNLDQVLASKTMKIGSSGGGPGAQAYEVAVEGWVDRPPGKERAEWVENVSDHCSLTFEVL